MIWNRDFVRYTVYLELWMKERNIKVFHKACNEYFIYEHDSDIQKHTFSSDIKTFIVGNKKDMTSFWFDIGLIDLH